MLKNLRETGLLDRVTGSGKPRISRSCDITAVEELAQSQRSKPRMHLSTIKIALRLKISHTTVLRIIRDD